MWPESEQKVEQKKGNWTDPTGQTKKQTYRALLLLNGRHAHKGCNPNSNTSPMSLPMNDLIILWSERVVVEGKKNPLYEKKRNPKFL